MSWSPEGFRPISLYLAESGERNATRKLVRSYSKPSRRHSPLGGSVPARSSQRLRSTGSRSGSRGRRSGRFVERLRSSSSPLSRRQPRQKLADTYHCHAAIIDADRLDDRLGPTSSVTPLLKLVREPFIIDPYERRTVSIRVNSVRERRSEYLCPDVEEGAIGNTPLARTAFRETN